MLPFLDYLFDAVSGIFRSLNHGISVTIAYNYYEKKELIEDLKVEVAVCSYSF